MIIDLQIDHKLQTCWNYMLFYLGSHQGLRSISCVVTTAWSVNWSSATNLILSIVSSSNHQGLSWDMIIDLWIDHQQWTWPNYLFFHLQITKEIWDWLLIFKLIIWNKVNIIIYCSFLKSPKDFTQSERTKRKVCYYNILEFCLNNSSDQKSLK